MKRSMRNFGALLFAGLWLWAGSGAAFGAGLTLPGVGTRAMSRGGAFVASGDDQTSQWHNPANISRLKGLRLLIDGAMLFNPYTFQRAQHPDSGKPFAEISNLAGPMPIPFVGLSYDLGSLFLPDNQNLVLSFAVWGPYDGKYQYDKGDDDSTQQNGCSGPNKDKFVCPENGPQRYGIMRFIPFQVYLGTTLAYGIDFGPVKVRLGGSLYFVQTEIEQRLALMLFGGNTGDPNGRSPLLPKNDGVVTIKATESFRPAFNLGLTLELPGGVAIGASYRPGWQVLSQGQFTEVSLPDDIKSAVKLSDDRSLTISFNMPTIIRAGIQWRPTFFPRIDLELAVVYEQWSVHDKLTLKSDKFTYSILGSKPEPLGELIIQREWQDSFSVRAGAQYAILPDRLFVRAGFWYETSAIPTNRTNLAGIHGERTGLAAGIEGKFRTGGLEFTIAFTYNTALTETLTVKDSKERAVVLAEEGMCETKYPAAEKTNKCIVGNGTYTRSAQMFMLTLGVAWDPLFARRKK